MTRHGQPIWFELSTSDADAAKSFYGRLLGWQFTTSGNVGFDYRLAQRDGVMVAGVMSLDNCPAGTPPNWLVYVAVDDTDIAAGSTAASGGQVLTAPTDVPGTGRFAVLADPQGAVFGVLHATPMGTPADDATDETGAWDQNRAGHGNWLELMSRDPQAGFRFYADLFGWGAGDALDMGEQGRYQLFRHNGSDIGGMMGLGDAPAPFWLPYFGVDDVARAHQVITDQGGTVLAGPSEVPGPALIVVAQDPQGATFAIVGPRPD
ncbi:VOC family protein [Paracoccus jiaweipingae]|uniref:VOC family protein n=1 Tax=unclassified Paracoccus (in: a-proteobacteria) TaxID=2688777 RepID=UPI0037AA5CEC